MLPAGNSAAGLSFGRLLKVLFLLALAGVAMRMTILAMPPVIPLVHRELHMSETQVGLLVGLPLALFAVAAVPGSLLIARMGTNLAVVVGMVIAALAGAARGAAFDIWTLYAAAIATGFGVAIMQPAMPTLVREWLPNRISLGTVVYSGGMLIGASLAPIFTIPYVLPLAGGSWRLNLVLWAVPAILIAPVFFLLSPASTDRTAAAKAMPGRWWPDWRNPVIWLIGFALGSNNSPYFATNALLGDYLTTEGRSDLLGPALGWLNGSQIVGSAHTFVCIESPAAARLAVRVVRPAHAGGFHRAHGQFVRGRNHRRRRGRRLHRRDDVRADPGAARIAQHTGRRSAHRRRHVHRQLFVRDCGADRVRRAVGHDRQTVDGLPAAVPLRRRADSPRRVGHAL